MKRELLVLLLIVVSIVFCGSVIDIAYAQDETEEVVEAEVTETEGEDDWNLQRSEILEEYDLASEEVSEEMSSEFSKMSDEEIAERLKLLTIKKVSFNLSLPRETVTRALDERNTVVDGQWDELRDRIMVDCNKAWAEILDEKSGEISGLSESQVEEKITPLVAERVCRRMQITEEQFYRANQEVEQ